MTRLLICIAAASIALTGYQKPVDACGVKLTIKSPRVRRAARSPNPSRILLLGDPPRSLAKQLSRKGHSVDVADSPGDASRKDYDVVVADADKVDEAESAFPNARIISRPSQNKTAVARVESSLARQPTRLARRTPIRSREDRLPIRVGGTAQTDQPEVVAAAETTPEPVAAEPAVAETTPEPTPEPTADNSDNKVAPEEHSEPVVAMNEEPHASEPAEPAPTHEPRHTQKAPRFASVVFFGTNQYHLSGRNRNLLRRDAKWLAINTDATITVAGHTDAAGAAQYNLMLSEKRANAVRDFLVSQGVDASRIEVLSFGEERPAYKNANKNRRVEIQK
ncbi:MAG TPA: OmpA family protein [Kofleriaceae bacterium]|nr:OmpA family protein [Kofleriaceae bacterium]